MTRQRGLHSDRVGGVFQVEGKVHAELEAAEESREAR